MVKLERSLSLWEVTLMGVGVILGAGIYVIIGQATEITGNSIWLSFIIGAIVASFTGLSYAELSSRFPKSGAEYVYIKDSFGNKFAWLVGWLIIAGNVIAAATVAKGFSHYFSALFNTPILLVALVLIIICGIILILGVKETATVTIFFTAIEIIGLIIVIFVGLPRLGQVNYLELVNGTKGLIEAGVLIFFAYLGFQGITRLSEETKNPEKNIPKAIILSILITTIIYILVGISAVSVIPWSELASSQAPLALVAQHIFGDQSFVILSVIALFSTFNTALMMLLCGSRLVFGIAEEKAIPSIFSRVSKKTLSPWFAIMWITVAASLFLFIGDLKTIANLTNFTIFTAFIFVNSSVIYFRYKKPVKKGFRVPLSVGKFPIIPLLGIITSIFMIVNLSFNILLMGFILIVIGVVFDIILDIKYE